MPFATAHHQPKHSSCKTSHKTSPKQVPPMAHQNVQTRVKTSSSRSLPPTHPFPTQTSLFFSLVALKRPTTSHHVCPFQPCTILRSTLKKMARVFLPRLAACLRFAPKQTLPIHRRGRKREDEEEGGTMKMTHLNRKGREKGPPTFYILGCSNKL